VHNRPHFRRRALAEVPRSLGEYLQQHAHWSRQLGERRGQQGQELRHRKLRIRPRGNFGISFLDIFYYSEPFKLM
jgi:hypothetical protein